MAFNYNEAIRDDILGPLDPFFDNRTLKYKRDGSIVVNSIINHDSPWHYVRAPGDKPCSILSRIIFPAFNFVPSRCQGCWKVVVRLRTLRELFQLEVLQEGCEFWCKCGIEIRPEVPANYGGYFYFNSSEEGIEGLIEVRKMIALGISKDIKVILKRGCTEMEAAFPNSSKWTVTDDQKRLEDKLFAKLVIPERPLIQTPEQVRRVKMNWVEFAWKIGDSTYSDYTDGLPLMQPPVNYEIAT